MKGRMKKLLSDEFRFEKELLQTNSSFIDEINFIYKKWKLKVGVGENATDNGYILQWDVKYKETPYF